jgi:protein TilB
MMPVESTSSERAVDSPLPPSPIATDYEQLESKRIITLDLLRKRSEHNEGLVSTLEELALHQEELQSIGPILGRTCGKTLKILLLQNNVIERMEPSELKLFRSLEYLNLALNNITKVEGIGRMECLRKLDLTLNFIDVDALEESVDEMSACRSLAELFLLGNPCMGIAASEGLDETASPTQKQIGWMGCRAYIIARLPNLQFLDGIEIKRSERILAMQQIPTLMAELHRLAEVRIMQRLIQKTNGGIDTGYISDDAPTVHNPETRTKISNESYHQRLAKDKQETENQPKLKGEKEWKEEHFDAVKNVREWEEILHGDDMTKQDGGIKQCNQGKYQYWFEEEEEHAKNGRLGTLIMRVAIPKFLSTSLIDVDVHPTYVSIVVKSKILRVVLPVEVVSDRSIARRVAASGYLELVMPKVNPEEVAIGSRHVRNGNNDRDQKVAEIVESGIAHGNSTTKECRQQKRERLGESLLRAGDVLNSLKIVKDKCYVSTSPARICDNDQDDDNVEPPPLI